MLDRVSLSSVRVMPSVPITLFMKKTLQCSRVFFYQQFTKTIKRGGEKTVKYNYDSAIVFQLESQKKRT